MDATEKSPRICPLTDSPIKREQADRQVATIAKNFPGRIAKPALRALMGAGYTRLEQLENIKEVDLLALHGMGPKALGILKAALRAQGKMFRL